MPHAMRLLTSLKRTALALIVAMTLVPSVSKAEPIREFVLSASYGVLAGTLVGAATLAFSDRPGDNLNRVARGASLGLYAGILLGVYIVYGVPAEEEEPVVLTEQDPQLRIASRQPSFLVVPLIGDRGLEGASAQVRVLSF